MQIVRWSILLGSTEGAGDGISMSVFRDFHADAYFNDLSGKGRKREWKREKNIGNYNFLLEGFSNLSRAVILTCFVFISPKDN